jgi:hypothetical protein
MEEAEQTTDDLSVHKLTKVYIKIRDARAQLSKDYKEQDKALEEQMDVVEQKLLDICKQVDANTIKTPAGLVMRGVDTRYWTNDWDSMYKFIKDNDALGLFEKRLHQTNMKQFLEEYPDKFPPGMLVDSKYKITVRRS